MTEEPATPDLVELARSFSEAFSRRDFDAIVALLARDAVWDTSSSVGLVGSVEGQEAIRGALEDWTGAYEDYKQVLEESCDLGNGVIFLVVVECGQLRGSSGSIERRIAAVGVWADGLAQRITSYADIDQARAAAERLAEERG
jgi:ketosteroid isomerase-like protein